MFPEYRDLISRLKSENPRFLSLFEKHNSLDHEISRLEGSDGRGIAWTLFVLRNRNST